MDYERLTKVVHGLGYTGLRSPQVRPVQTLLQKESLICVLPTGCGKTAVFTIPTLYHNWRTLVISPLLALMENQSKSLNRMGVKAMEISSRTSQTANKLACELWANDTLRMLYVAPERLSTEMFTKLMQDYPPDHICVDECIHIDTLVTTLHGAKKASDICAGESILSFNERGEIETDRVVSVCEKGIRPTWRITTRRGVTLLCTSNEKLYTPRGWVYLAEFLSNDQRLFDARERQSYDNSEAGASFNFRFSARGCVTCQTENLQKSKDCFQTFLETSRVQYGKDRIARAMVRGSQHAKTQRRLRRLQCCNSNKRVSRICVVRKALSERWEKIRVARMGKLSNMGISSLVAARRRNFRKNTFMLHDIDALVHVRGSKETRSMVRKSRSSRRKNIHCRQGRKEVSSNNNWNQGELSHIKNDKTLCGSLHAVQVRRERIGNRSDMRNMWKHFFAKQETSDIFEKIRTRSMPVERLSTRKKAYVLEGMGKEKEIYVKGVSSLDIDCIESIEYEGLLPVLDIETEKNHTFFANNIAVHNCHVLSAWGDDFRPDYTHIGDFIDMYKPSVVSAFTATATKHILEDIRRVLRLENAPFIFNYPRRNNLHYMSITKEIERPVAQCADLIRKYIKDGSAIIYCSTVETVESLSMMLEHELHGDYGVVYYHGQMASQSLKDLNNRDFMEGAAKVMVATKAFGMGVDKSDVRLVIEFNTSDSLESLAQQQGRAGRDGKEAHCITLWTPQSSSEYYNLFYANSRPSLNQIQRIYKLLVDTAANSPKGAVKLTERQIAGICRINDRIVGSTMGLLDSQGIIRRESNSEDVYSIQFHVDPTEEVYEGSYVRKIYDVINTYGLEREEEKGIYDISMETLHTSLGRSKGTAQSWLRTCVTNQQISYQLPYRGSVTYILRPLDELNFEHIRKKRMLEDRRLQDVMNYCRLPDDEKQDHLIAYFREAVEND